MELEPSVSPHEIAEKHGHEYLGPIGTLQNFHLFKKKIDTIHGETHPHHDQNERVLWSERQVKKTRAKRGIPLDSEENFPRIPEVEDPMYRLQWHLHGDLNINARSAWMMGFSGKGVNVAIVDDGIQYDHPDLSQNFKMELSYDFNYNDSNPYPDNESDDHGTAAGGLAAAGRNQYCGVGVAFNAGLSAIRVISIAATDAQEAGAIHYKKEFNHIYSNSWGPIDDGRRKEGPGKLAKAALEDGIRNGRGGKGNIYCWAGGNGRPLKDNCNYDGWANSRYTITVAAITHTASQADYSESCSMILISAPSSGSGWLITSTDLMGSRGASNEDCTTRYGGTSASSPIAAGVMALILEANPELTWRDMQNVLIQTAIKVLPRDESWFENGAKISYSHKFGFGGLDAGASVRLAMNYTLLPQELNTTVEWVSKTNEGIQIQYLKEQPFEMKIESNFVIEHTRLSVWTTINRRGQLQISLLSPSGTRSELAEVHGDNGQNYEGWDFGSIANWGETSKGTFKVILKNHDGFVAGANRLILTVYGHRLPPTN